MWQRKIPQRIEYDKKSSNDSVRDFYFVFTFYFFQHAVTKNFYNEELPVFVAVSKICRTPILLYEAKAHSTAI